jgi:hypothetical protein
VAEWRQGGMAWRDAQHHYNYTGVWRDAKRQTHSHDCI